MAVDLAIHDWPLPYESRLEPRALTVDLSQFAGPVAGRWYNPTNGRVTAIGGAPFPNRATRPFRTPGVPWIPAAGAIVCLAQMLGLPGETWVRLFIWLVIGLVI